MQINNILKKEQLTFQTINNIFRENENFKKWYKNSPKNSERSNKYFNKYFNLIEASPNNYLKYTEQFSVFLNKFKEYLKYVLDSINDITIQTNDFLQS